MYLSRYRNIFGAVVSTFFITGTFEEEDTIYV